MIFEIWLLGFILFFIYDHIIGFKLPSRDEDFIYMALAGFWWITMPVLLLKWLIDTLKTLGHLWRKPNEKSIK